MAKTKYHHKISNTYDAYWFIHDHPKFMLEERTEVSGEEADRLEARGYWITRDRGGKCYRMWRHLHRHAIDHALDIHYAKVNERGRVDDDPKKNMNVECWLEFGQETYMYGSDWDTQTYRTSYHDPNLDCGGKTFDEALIRLAKLVRKHYGDYKLRKHGRCGRPTCADCIEIDLAVKKMKLD